MILTVKQVDKLKRLIVDRLRAYMNNDENKRSTISDKIEKEFGINSRDAYKLYKDNRHKVLKRRKV